MLGKDRAILSIAPPAAAPTMIVIGSDIEKSSSRDRPLRVSVFGRWRPIFVARDRPLGR
jgi:hypothetical protein